MASVLAVTSMRWAYPADIWSEWVKNVKLWLFGLELITFRCTLVRGHSPLRWGYNWKVDGCARVGSGRGRRRRQLGPVSCKLARRGSAEFGSART